MVMRLSESNLPNSHWYMIVVSAITVLFKESKVMLS